MAARRQPMTDEERAAKVAALVGRLDDAVAELADGDRWMSMLRASGTFRNYSFRNMMLLAQQAEERGMTLTAVAGFTAWRDLGRSVRKGEHGLAIFAPLTRKADPEQGQPVGARVMYGVRVVHVFDIAQTDGDESPTPPPATAGRDARALWTGLEALVRAEGFEVVRASMPDPEEHGRTDLASRVVSVRPDLDDTFATAVLAHELGHLRAGHEHRQISGAQRETEAESIAYVVLGAHGLDCADSAGPYIAGWSGGDPDVVASAAEAIHTAATGILADLTGPDAIPVPSSGSAPSARAQRATAQRPRPSTTRAPLTTPNRAPAP